MADIVDRFMNKAQTWAAGFLGFFLGIITGHPDNLGADPHQPHDFTGPYHFVGSFLILGAFIALVAGVLFSRWGTRLRRPTAKQVVVDRKTFKVFLITTAIFYTLGLLSNGHPFCFW